MQEVNSDLKMEQILMKDSRYTREAYLFVRESLDFTQKLIKQQNRGAGRQHVSPQELLDGIRQCALKEFGPMAMTVLEEWGVKSCADFGEIVFNMFEVELLAKAEKDTREDFHHGYDFTDAFQKPFWPQNKMQAEKKSMTELS